jgi:hypothetical protein
MRLLLSISALLGLTLGNSIVRAQDTTLAHDQLIQDTRELLRIIETAHPDPYIDGGGRIELHRKFQSVLDAIPDTGMSLQEFIWLLQPFVNSIGDGHTSINNPFFSYDPAAPYGTPFWFSVSAEKGLYISRVAREEFAPLIGSKLITVEEYSLPELMQKTRQLRPCQNDYDVLWNLNGMLWERYFLDRLLPEMTDKEYLNVTIELPIGTRQEKKLELSKKRSYPLTANRVSQLDLPSTRDCDFAYAFLSPDENVAFLRIDRQDGFREIVEYGLSQGYDESILRGFGAPIYERFNENSAPADFDSLLLGIPSGTEVFRDLVRDMKERGTETLIIDLSRNNGGQSILSQILIYFLYGKEKLEYLMQTAFTVDRYSEYYFSVFSDVTLDELNAEHLKRHAYRLTGNDYNFVPEEERALLLSGAMTPDRVDKTLEDEFRPYTTFYGEYESRQHNCYYTPKRVIVICSERTYSAGFGSLVDLYKCGATVVGIPSGQSGNCSGNAIYFELNNSGVSGFVSTKYIEMFPGDSIKGEELMPHFPLTFDVLRGYDFDPNAVFRYALDSLAGAVWK